VNHFVLAATWTINYAAWL